MVVSIAYMLATLIACFSGSAGGAAFVLGLQMKSSGLVAGGLITFIGGFGIGAGVYGLGNLIAWV